MGSGLSQRFVRFLAGLAVVIIAASPALSYFFVEYIVALERLERDAQVQAHLVSKVVAHNPEGWRYAAERLTEAVAEVRSLAMHTHISDNAGKQLAAVGEEIGYFNVHRSAPFFDYGKPVGTVDVGISLDGTVKISAALLLLGGSIGWLLQVRLRRVLKKLDATEQELRIAATAFESQVGVMVTDERTAILRVNRTFTQITGYSAEEAVGKTPALLKSGRHGQEFYRALWEALARDKYWQGEIWNRRKNGEIFPTWQTITAVAGPDGRVTHYVTAFSDIAERKEAEQQIHNLAFFDPLTHLPNRRLLIDRMQHAFAASARSRRYGALLFIDLDQFKVLNDTKGHDAGDQLLIQVALRLLSGVREGDSVSRLGGDEFVVMVEGLDHDQQIAANQAKMVSEKIRDALNRPYTLKARNGRETYDYSITPSIGGVLFYGHASTFNELLQHADIAMYQAKAAGRNTVRFFDSVG